MTSVRIPNTVNFANAGRVATGLGLSRAFSFAMGQYMPNSFNPTSNTFQNKNMPASNTRRLTAVQKRNWKKVNSRKLATVSSVKKMINGVMEKKQRIVPPTFAGVIANTIYSYNLTAQILQGTTDGTRVGDTIYLTSYKCNLRWSTAAPAAFYQLRVLVVWCGEEYNPSTTVFSTAGLTAAELFVAGGPGFSISNINTKGVTVLQDTLLEINSNQNYYEDGTTLRMSIPLNQTFKYQQSGSTFGKTKNLYVVVIPDWIRTLNVPTGPPIDLAPTNAGNVVANGVLYYTDA